jgi:SAM-dependent methyltransferase
MNVFQLVKLVLDEQYDSIGGTEAERDDAIRARIQALMERYLKLAEENSVTYRKPVTRFAYIYKYVTSHSNLTYKMIERCKALRDLFLKDQVTVSCVGGGPGSELLGVLKYMARLDELPLLRCYLLDREIGWADAWSDVDEKAKTDCKVSSYFIPMDVTDPENWAAHSKYLKADLFTMVYFASEIFCKRDRATPYFEHLFKGMRPGAYILYIDNNSPTFSEWFDNLSAKQGLTEVAADAFTAEMTYDEEKTDLGDYLDKFGPVKLKAKVAYRVLRKEAP